MNRASSLESLEKLEPLAHLENQENINPTLMYNYIAIARNGAGIIAKGDRITFQSERQVEESTGLSFRKEIAEACRQQLHAEIDPSQEATNATNFDVYSESRYEEVREKLEAAAAREAAAEERRRKAEEREQAKAEREAAKGNKTAATNDNGRIGQHGDAIRPKKKTTTKKKPISLGPLGKIKLKSLLKFLVAAVAIIWFVSTNLKSCSLESILKEFGVKTEQTTTKKKTSTTKKKSTSSATTKKSSTSKKSSTTSTAKKKTSTSKSTSTAKKKSTSTTKKKSTSTKRKSTK